MKKIASTIVRNADIALNGNLYGGTLLEWCDRYGSLFTYECLNHVFVTYKMGSVHFMKTAKLGELIVFYADNIKFNKISVSFDLIAKTRDQKEIINTSMTFVSVEPDTGKPKMLNPFLFEREEFELGVKQGLKTSKAEKELKAISVKVKPFNLDTYKNKYSATLYMFVNDNDRVAAISQFQKDYGKILEPSLISEIIREISTMGILEEAK